jgi:hypothetical protein
VEVVDVLALVVVDDVVAPSKFDIHQYVFYLRLLWKFVLKKLPRQTRPSKDA